MTLTGRSKSSVTCPGRAATATAADGAADGARSVADVETPEPSSQRSQEGGAAVTRTCTVRPCGTAATGTKPVPWCASASGRPALVARMAVTSVPTPPRCTWTSASPDDTDTAGRPRSATSTTPMPTITTAAPAPIPARTIQDRFFCSADGLVIVPPSRARCALFPFLSPPGRVLPSSPAPKTPRHRLPLGGGHPAAVLAERPARVRPHAASHPGVLSLGYRTAVPASKAVPKSAPCRDPAFQDQLMDRLAVLTGVALFSVAVASSQIRGEAGSWSGACISRGWRRSSTCRAGCRGCCMSRRRRPTASRGWLICWPGSRRSPRPPTVLSVLLPSWVGWFAIT